MNVMCNLSEGIEEKGIIKGKWNRGIYALKTRQVGVS